jgi:hypothetical protein
MAAITGNLLKHYQEEGELIGATPQDKAHGTQNPRQYK